jgi:hypothetical protein
LHKDSHVLLIKCYFGDQIKEDEMGHACGMYGGEEKCIQILAEKMKERDHLEDLGVNRTTLK